MPRRGPSPARDNTDAPREPSPPRGADEGQSATNSVDEPQRRGKLRIGCPYSDDDGRIVWFKPTVVERGKVEFVPTELANFKARIISDVTRDDGVETVRHYEIAATLGNRPFLFEVPAARFYSLSWVAEHMGAGAVVAPGQGMASRLVHAILMPSAGFFGERTIYTHTGWRNIDRADYFLHAGGALGADGYRSDIDVDIPEQLARIELIEPADQAELKRAVRESVLLQNLAGMRVMAPLLGAVYRAPLGGSDITVALYGQTGRGKNGAGRHRSTALWRQDRCTPSAARVGEQREHFGGGAELRQGRAGHHR
jgi:hypothetical protein